MSPTAYQAAAARTLPAALSDRERLSMLALGVVGEWAEYGQATNVAKLQARWPDGFRVQG